MAENPKNRKLYIIVLFLIALALIIGDSIIPKAFHEFSQSNVSWYWLILLILFSYLVKNLKIRFKAEKLITNSLAIFPLIIWIGPVFGSFAISILSILWVPSSIGYKIPRIYRYLHRFAVYFLMYYIAQWVFSRPYQFHQFVIFILIAELVNFCLLHIFLNLATYRKIRITKDILITSTYEILFPLILVPLSQSIVILLDRGDSLAYGLTYIFPVMVFFYFLTTRFHSLYWMMRQEQTKLTWYKNGLENVLLGSNMVRSTEDADQILQKWIQHLARSLRFKIALISLIDYDTGMIKRVAHYGLTEESFTTLRERTVYLKDTKVFFSKEYYFGGGYFIPAESLVIQQMDDQLFWISSEKEDTKDKNSWNVDDLFIIPFSDSANQMIGYISLDLPVNGKRPTIEEAEMANLFAEQIGKIVEASKEYGRMAEKAKKDLMTGLHNHTYFFEILEERIKTASIENPLSLIMFDIDNFKILNDTYGHKKGDSVLVQTAKIIQSQLPAGSFCSRYGGEEFAVLLFGCDKMKSLQIGNAILSAIREKEWGGISVTISGGVATVPEDGRDASSIVNASDNALYFSKRTGKDKIIHA
jgi:diguanylate cyclase (GGDEF)-like protein